MLTNNFFNCFSPFSSSIYSKSNMITIICWWKKRLSQIGPTPDPGRRVWTSRWGESRLALSYFCWIHSCSWAPWRSSSPPLGTCCSTLETTAWKPTSTLVYRIQYCRASMGLEWVCSYPYLFVLLESDCLYIAVKTIYKIKKNQNKQKFKSSIP